MTLHRSVFLLSLALAVPNFAGSTQDRLIVGSDPSVDVETYAGLFDADLIVTGKFTYRIPTMRSITQSLAIDQELPVDFHIESVLYSRREAAKRGGRIQVVVPHTALSNADGKSMLSVAILALDKEAKNLQGQLKKHGSREDTGSSAPTDDLTATDADEIRQLLDETNQLAALKARLILQQDFPTPVGLGRQIVALKMTNENRLFVLNNRFAIKSFLPENLDLIRRAMAGLEM